MSHSFDKEYWESHWGSTVRGPDAVPVPASPYVDAELAGLEPGTALDAGCGEGAEAIRLAGCGWSVTGADISAEVLARAARRAETAGVDVRWIEADLGVWEPRAGFDLVTTFYAHPAMPQLDFYERIAGWVAPGGTLLIVGHLQDADPGHAHAHAHGHEPAPAGHGHGEPPREATVTAASVVEVLGRERWEIVTAEERSRELADPAGRPVALRDVVVRATRRRD